MPSGRFLSLLLFRGLDVLRIVAEGYHHRSEVGKNEWDAQETANAPQDHK